MGLMGILKKNTKNFLFDSPGRIRLRDFWLAPMILSVNYYASVAAQAWDNLEDSNGIGNGTKTKRMDRSKDVELLMGDGNGPSGIFTWQKNCRKVTAMFKLLPYVAMLTSSLVSPEVIRSSFSWGWWILGIIMFECLYGNPVDGPSVQRNFARIHVIYSSSVVGLRTRAKVVAGMVSTAGIVHTWHVASIRVAEGIYMHREWHPMKILDRSEELEFQSPM
ncbi:hypothetical protein P692DRAFT_20862416 [Suillus brevipes Sb2]|nr:hypothetical protein P692DRAFT_20862416 [Suillus brevipes Sb2]